MKIRVWQGCQVVVEIQIPEPVEERREGQVAWYPDDSPIVGEDDHVSLDPWALLAGEHLGNRSHSVDISLPRTEVVFG